MKATFLHIIRERIKINSSEIPVSVLHPGLSLSRIKKDERDILDLQKMIINEWINLDITKIIWSNAKSRNCRKHD